MQRPTVTFRVAPAANVLSRELFRPRLGALSLSRPNGPTLVVNTPGLLTVAPQGVVPHLSKDHVLLTEAIKWINLPLESFLEHTQPLPTRHAISKLCGFSQDRHILSLSLRNPADTRHVPNNGDKYVHVLTTRGAKKITPATFKAFLRDSSPDIVFVQGDTCIGNAPHSQKRLTKELERSCSWLLELLSVPDRPQNIFLSLVGGESVEARSVFAKMLLEPPDERERQSLQDLACMDQGVFGYAIDLAPLRLSLAVTSTDAEKDLERLVKASLCNLPSSKPRLVNTALSPFQVLDLVQLGIDLFDVQWALDAAQWGVALDFSFPTRQNGLLGHNLYDPSYSTQFVPLSNADLLADSAPGPLDHNPGLTSFINSKAGAGFGHDGLVAPSQVPPLTRAYIHHLLQTHEIAAHALLVMHNLFVADAFFAGIRGQLSDGPEVLEKEIKNFLAAHERSAWNVLEEGKQWWMKVDRERGKGRLRREREGDGVGGQV